MFLGKARVRNGLRVFAIGDIHGCVQQLDELLGLIDVYQAKSPVERNKLVFLGDYVDRGPDNSAVIDYLISLKKSDRDCVFLLGNHDERMLQFLRDPSLVWDQMMKWGGAQTLASYGIIPNPGETQNSVAERFAANVPAKHVKFLKKLKPCYQVDDYFFCHAGVRPGVLLKDQSEHDLIWIRHDFLENERPYERVIVHGHTPVPEPEVRPNRINVDTRCYDSGVLTAVVLENCRYGFLQTKKR